MPDEQQPTSKIEYWIDKIMRWAGPIILAYLALLGTRNTVKVDSVEQKQVEAVERTQVVKDTLDKKQVVDTAKSKEDSQAIKINLYGTWKYLDEQAITQKDRDKVTEAKLAYDEYVKKNPK